MPSAGRDAELDEGELVKTGGLSQHRIYDPGKGPGDGTNHVSSAGSCTPSSGLHQLKES